MNNALLRCSITALLALPLVAAGQPASAPSSPGSTPEPMVKAVDDGAPLPLNNARANFAPNTPPGEWHRQARDYANTRYSTLDQITADNVAKLRVAWSFSDGTPNGHETAPLVVGDTMYIVTPFPNIAYRARPEQGRRADQVVVRAAADAAGHRQGLLRHGQPRQRLCRRQADLQPAGRPHHRARREDRQGTVAHEDGRRDQGRDHDHGAVRRRRQGLRGQQRRRDGRVGLAGRAGREYRQGTVARVQHRHRQGGADRPGLQAALFVHAGQGPGRDDWPPGMEKTGAGAVWGWVSYDPEIEPHLLRHQQPRPARAAAAPGVEPVVERHLRARRHDRHGEVGLPVHAPRPVGLRRRQRERAARHRLQGPAAQGAGAFRPQCFRLHPRPPDRRGAGRRALRVSELVARHRPEDRHAEGRRRHAAQAQRQAAERLPARHRRQGLAAGSVFAAHGLRLRRHLQHLHGCDRTTRSRTSPARLTTAWK